MKKNRLALLFLCVLMPALLFSVSSWVSPATLVPMQQETPANTPIAIQTPQVGWLIVDLPPGVTQLEYGAEVYRLVCRACHGDKGQGLTDEWRAQWEPIRQNCWQSKCHARNHPPDGFDLPRVVPPVVGPQALLRFKNAEELYTFIDTTMPWHDPGSLTEQEVLGATAYILSLNHKLPENFILNGNNAAAVPVQQPVAPPRNDNTAIFIFIGMVALAVIALIFRDFSIQPETAPDRVIVRAPRPNFFAHLHPPTIPTMQARWRYTLGAGGMAVFLALMLIVTGLLEMFYYIPTPEKAATSVQTITNFVPFGALIRNLHYWSAQLLVIIALIHLARVIFTGAYSAQRKFNFLLGSVLLVFILWLDFTGYILRWDEGIRWALIAGTNLLKSIPYIGDGLYLFVVGGSELGPAALLRFYSWHIFILTFAFGIITGWHLFRVRRDGGIAAAPAGQRETPERITRAELLKREVLGMFMGGIILLILATFIPAPIAPPISDSTALNADASAPWFFLWVQQLLKFGDPFLLGILLPLAVMFFISAIPYIFTNIKQDELGRWFPRSGRIVQLLFAIIAVILIALTLFSLINPL